MVVWQEPARLETKLLKSLKLTERRNNYRVEPKNASYTTRGS